MVWVEGRQIKAGMGRDLSLPALWLLQVSVYMNLACKSLSMAIARSSADTLCRLQETECYIGGLLTPKSTMN